MWNSHDSEAETDIAWQWDWTWHNIYHKISPWNLKAIEIKWSKSYGSGEVWLQPLVNDLIHAYLLGFVSKGIYLGPKFHVWY